MHTDEKLNTDKELNDIAKIAYIDFDENYKLLCEANPGRTEFTIQELLDADTSSAFDANNNIQRNNEGITVGGVDISNKDLNSWKIVAIHDTNASNGFYGCAIDTGDGNVVLSFRGSEAGSKAETYDDWVINDVGLAVETPGKLTPQHQEAITWMNELKDNGFLDKYNSISTTGHSLGGNLSEFTAMYFFSQYYTDKLVQCANFDGPGVNDIMRAYFKKNYDVVHDKITLYKASAVGEIFHQTAELYMNVIHIKCDEVSLENLPEFLRGIVGEIILHSQCHYMFDDDGNACQEDISKTSIALSTISLCIDTIPHEYKLCLYDAISSIADNIFEDKINENGDVEGVSVNCFNAAMYFMACSVKIVPVNNLLKSFDENILGGTLTNINTELFNLFKEPLNNLDILLETFLTNCVEIGIITIEQSKNIFGAFLKGNWSSIKVQFNAIYGIGVQYSNANPCINVDTDFLRVYAGRIYNVNNRISELDSRLKSLYWKVGIRGLWNLIRADMLTGYSWRLTRCQNYLNNTADNFDTAENDVINLFK